MQRINKTFILSVSKLRALNNEKFNSVMPETENIQVNSWGFS